MGPALAFVQFPWTLAGPRGSGTYVAGALSADPAPLRLALAPRPRSPGCELPLPWPLWRAHLTPGRGRRRDRPTSSNSATSLLPRGADRNSWTPSGPPGAEGGPGLSLRPSCHQIGGSTIFVHQGHRRGPGCLGDGLLHAAWVGHMPLYFQLSIFFFSQDFIPEDETRTHV